MNCLSDLFSKLIQRGLFVLTTTSILLVPGPPCLAQSLLDSPNWLNGLGAVPNGSMKETEDLWCVFNDWQARDAMKRKYTGNNVNIKTTFGGTWFCVQKR
jgi:hypothetical protein